jgi:glycosyltransferase involved in cell wall biosynthesis
MVGHQFQVPTEGQAKAEALGRLPDLDILTLAPDRYREAEKRWRFAVVPDTQNFSFGIERVRLPWSGPAKWYLQWYPEVERTVRRFKPDIIDLWEEPWGLLSFQFCAIRDRVCPQAVLISETEQNINRILPPPFEWFRRRTFECADFVIGRSAEAIEVARKKGYSGPAQVVGNGVDLDLFQPCLSEDTRSRFGMHGFAVGYAGRLVLEKGVMDLVEAVDGLPGDTSLWICGTGPLKSQLERVSSRVHVLESIPRAVLAQFFSALDVLVLPSRTTPTWMEQFGRVLIEAQACGTPVIASRSGSMPGVLSDSALLFEEGSIEELRSAILRLRGDSNLRATLSRRGRARVESFYSWGAIAQQMRGIYQECLMRTVDPSGGNQREAAQS